MSGPHPSDAAAAPLGQLLLMQNVLCGLPDERSIYGFVCRGLAMLPGVAEVRQGGESLVRGDDRPTVRLPLAAAGADWGELVLALADPAAFAPYESYLRNFAVMVALILEERAQRRMNERHQQELELRVMERTKRLSEENAERRRVEEELRKHRDVLVHTLDSVPQAIFWKDLNGVYRGCNRVFAAMAGFVAPEEIVGLTDADVPWAGAEAERMAAEDREIIEQREPRNKIAAQIHRSDGQRLWIEATKVPLFDADGRVYALLGVVEDVTDRRRAEMEREALQTQLLHAQKMESVGRLAGGVAHDFNNMLQAILGNASLALTDATASGTLREHLEEILKAAERSANLTHQLLAFARKQTATPKVLDLNAVVESTLKMLHRLIGEHLELVWSPAAGLWPVRIDPVQVDQLVTNIVVNARDAIRGSGRITLETGNVTIGPEESATAADLGPGDYVRVAVTDTGVGMSEETLSHLFEPFFTTKKVGEGTGLGLAMVYGILKQNQGAVRVRSAPGQGSTFMLFLPRSAEPAVAAAAVPAVPTRRGSETILLVEDEEQILTLVSRVLQQQGYQVIAAAHPHDALRRAEEFAGAIHLLITDVIMPGMNGRDLHERIVKLKPGVRCLFISGYTSDVIANEGVIEEGIHFQPKPFTASDLITRVREVLDGAGP